MKRRFYLPRWFFSFQIWVSISSVIPMEPPHGLSKFFFSGSLLPVHCKKRANHWVPLACKLTVACAQTRCQGFGDDMFSYWGPTLRNYRAHLVRKLKIISEFSHNHGRVGDDRSFHAQVVIIGNQSVECPAENFHTVFPPTYAYFIVLYFSRKSLMSVTVSLCNS